MDSMKILSSFLDGLAVHLLEKWSNVKGVNLSVEFEFFIEQSVKLSKYFWSLVLYAFEVADSYIGADFIQRIRWFIV
jgi:hypothetical protein